MALIENYSHTLWQYRKCNKHISHTRYDRHTVILCGKYWNSDMEKAIRLYYLLKHSGRYDKVKLHKNCVYVTKYVSSFTASTLI